ncbi:MAG: glutamate-5-semialdehyde dehydrogenase, partial [Pseudomonadota bacterium]
MSEAASKQPDTSFMTQTGPALRQSAYTLSKADSDQINQCLGFLFDKLKNNVQAILDANIKDIENAKANKQTDAFIDRLTLNEERIQAIAQSVEDIAKLEDPCGEILEDWTRPNGLHIQKVSVPIGVLGIIYESRPNVTIDAAALCLKSHNACLLRGGSDSLNTALVLHSLIEDSLSESNLPSAAVSMIKSGDRSLLGNMLKAYDYIDVIVPRGGRGLIERVMNEAAMPVFAHLDGNCHIFVDQSVNADMARDVIVNAKLRRTGICGAAESLLFHNDLNQDTAKDIITALLDQDCEVIGDEKTQRLDSRVQAAHANDWSTEYLDAKISCKYVSGIDEAISHINTYGSNHTDAIITEGKDAAAQFQKEVDSAIILHNASTQFAD